VYDWIYTSQKDYEAETTALLDLVRERVPDPASLLDVGCGTGEHLRYLGAHFREVTGADVSQDMLAVARTKNIDADSHHADMRTLALHRTFDVVTCLFSAIGYMPTTGDLRAAAAAITAHVRPGGLAIVEPWLTPQSWIDGYLSHEVFRDGDRQLMLMAHSSREGRFSRVRTHHLIGDRTGVTHFIDERDLTLFTTEEYLEAFAGTGCTTEYLAGGPSGRGLILAMRSPTPVPASPRRARTFARRIS
jgi:SAM-dependent methyltransferase